MAPKSESPRTPREAAFTGICRMLKDKAYSNLLLDSLLRQLPVTEALRVASVASSLAVSRKGASSSIPTWEEVQQAKLELQS